MATRYIFQKWIHLSKFARLIRQNKEFKFVSTVDETVCKFVSTKVKKANNMQNIDIIFQN